MKDEELKAALELAGLMHAVCIKGKAHSFEPRYDYGEALGGKGTRPTQEFIALMEASKSKTYVYDICIKCGKVVNRAKGN